MNTTPAPPTTKIAPPNPKIPLRSNYRPPLFVTPHDGVVGSAAFIELVARKAAVIVQSHPGFGPSELPKDMASVDDMSSFYLALIESLGLRDLVVVGAWLGGWFAAEIAPKTTE